MARVLAVDDDRTTLALVRAALEGAGHSVEVCSQPDTVVALLEEGEIDALVLDVVMPERSGLDVLAEIRTTSATVDVPVLMLSALSSGEDRIKGLRQGADDYLPKPFEAEELVLRVERLLAQAVWRSAKLQGDLEYFSVQELLQHMHQGSKTGLLAIRGGGGPGEILLSEGRVARAWYGGLEGMEAVVALTEPGRGSFHFEPAAASPQAELHNIQRILLYVAWLRDELGRRPEIDLETPLHATGAGEPEIASEYASIPWDIVLAKVAAEPGVNLRDLLLEGVAAPQRLRLAVALLTEAGSLTAGEVEALPAAPTEVDELDELETATQAVLRVARAHGFQPAMVNILLAAGPTAAAAGSLRPLLESIPDEVAPRVDKTLIALRTGQGTSFRARSDQGTVRVHIEPLNQTAARTRAQALLSSCVGVAAVASSATDADTLRWLVDGVEANAPRQVGVMITDSEAAEVMLFGKESWRLLEAMPSSFAELLRAVVDHHTAILDPNAWP